VIILEDFSGNGGSAAYNSFSFGDESQNFRLSIGTYNGTIGEYYNIFIVTNYMTPTENL